MKTTRWDIQDYIKTPETQLAFLEAVLEDGDPHLIAAALGDIAKARGMTIIAEEIGLSCMASKKGDPRLSTLLGILKALDLKLKIEPAA